MHLIRTRFRLGPNSKALSGPIGKVLRKAVTQPRLKEFRAALNKDPGPGRRVVYMHIPFCSARCPYCPFHVGMIGPQMGPFVDATLRLIETLGEKPFVKGAPFDTFYFGGGSPTALPLGELERLIKATLKVFRPVDSHEFTVESTIRDLDGDKLKMMRDNGVTRVSVGVQSFNTEIRRNLGRVCDRDTNLSALELLQRSGLRTAIDLMYGIPGQTVANTVEDLQYACKLGLDNVSHFRLKVFGGTAFADGVKSGSFVQESLEAMGEMQLAGIEAAKSRGYHHWHVTDFGSTPEERCAYTAVPLAPRDMIALGAAGCGFLNLLKFRTEANVESFMKRCHKGRYPMFGMLKDKMERYYIRKVRGQLEVGELDLDLMGRLFDVDARELHAEQLEMLAEKGWVTVNGPLVRFTPNGMVHADEVRESLKAPKRSIRIKFEDFAAKWTWEDVFADMKPREPKG